MIAWLYLIAAFGSWFAAGVLVGVLLMRAAPDAPGTGDSLHVPGRAPTP